MYCVPANMSTLEALSQMARDHKSSLGVTDPANGQLISNLSVSDLRWDSWEGFESGRGWNARVWWRDGVMLEP